MSLSRRLLAVGLLAWASLVQALPLEVVIEGLVSEQEDNVRSFLSLEREKDREGLTEGRLRLLHREAPAEIRQALQPFGLVKPLF